MDKTWHTIESLAQDTEISTRTAWRWLRAGKIKKRRSEDGQAVFALTTDNDTDNVSSDMSVAVSSDTSERKIFKNKKGYPRPSGALSRSLHDELETNRLSFEIEKLQDIKDKWKERRDREQKEKMEREECTRLKETQFREIERQRIQREQKARNTIQEVKRIVCGKFDGMIPSHILSELYASIETRLSSMDVINIPFLELRIVAEGVCIGIFRIYKREIEVALRQLLKQLEYQIRQTLLSEVCNVCIPETERHLRNLQGALKSGQLSPEEKAVAINFEDALREMLKWLRAGV